METKNEIKSSASFEEIEKEAATIYPESIESIRYDEESNNFYTITDWSYLFYYGKSKLIKNRFMEIVSKSEFAKFFEALDYEYGINGKIKSLNTAFDIYKDKANNSTDILCMYKMFHIYKNEYMKFGLKKRNKILERFYLFKSFAHLSKQEYEEVTYPLNRFQILYDFRLYKYFEDNDLIKFTLLIDHLMKYYDYYQIKLDDVILIKSFISFVIMNDNNTSKTLLEPLIIKGNLEAIYQLALLSDDKDKTKKLFENLEKSNYYRCYCDYAIFLSNEMNDHQKALKILKIAISQGNIGAHFLYYSIFLDSIDFSTFPFSKNCVNDILFLFNLLINNICLDNAFSYYEFFYLRKLCIKHFNLKDLVDKNFYEYEKEFINILNKYSPTSNLIEDIDEKKELIKSLYFRSNFFCEFNFACGFIYYLGIGNILKQDLKKSLFKFQICYDNAKSYYGFSYFGLCYSYIVKIKEKLLKLNDKDITIKDLETSRNKLFELYSSFMEKHSLGDLLNSSFLYYLYLLYSKKWGNQGDILMEYFCIKRASEYKIKYPGGESIITYYRRHKAKLIKKSDKVLIKKLKELIKNDYEDNDEDDKLCPICFFNKKNVILYPCKHRFCKVCIDKIIENPKCPICRNFILINLDINELEK